jgi:hypothetical protein
VAISLNGTIRQACYQSPGKVFAIYRPQEALGGSLVAQALEGADLGAAHTQQATPGGVKVPAQAKGTTSRLRRRHRLKAKAAAEAAEEATWASLLGEEMQLGPMKESDEEYDVWAHYLRVMDDNFDYNL